MTERERSIDYRDLGIRLRRARLACGMTQEQLAERVDMGTTHISHIETGHTVPSLKTFVGLVNALGVSADELLCGSLRQSGPVYAGELAALLEDCNERELRLMVEVARTLKEGLRRT